MNETESEKEALAAHKKAGKALDAASTKYDSFPCNRHMKTLEEAAKAKARAWKEYLNA